jgi:hypothetical protein
MRLAPSLKRRPAVHLWRVCVCLLLVALVVYNPFTALDGSSGRLSYENLARNRASIGSGELQHFSPVSDPDAPFDLDVDSRDAEPVIDVRETQLDRTQQETIPSEPALLAGFWFRPPPSL